MEKAEKQTHKRSAPKPRDKREKERESIDLKLHIDRDK